MTPPVSGERHERAVEAAARWTGSCEPQPSTHAIIAAYFAEFERQGVRLVEQPKCPRCNGRGTLGGATQSAIVEPWTCPRCGGSGYERMVALGEVVDWLRQRQNDMNAAPLDWAAVGAHLERRFGGGER